MMLAIWLFENEFIRIVSISFTSLILNELLMVALEITTWYNIISFILFSFLSRRAYMIYSQVITLAAYIGSMWLMPNYFGNIP